MGKSLSNKYSQKPLDSAKKSTTNAIKNMLQKVQFRKLQKEPLI